jgi:hypothetical protein
LKKQHTLAEKLDVLIQKKINWFFVITYVTTLAYMAINYLEHNGWCIEEWLINYQGGIIRRGFVGEIIYKLALYTGFNPGIYAVLFQAIFYALFFYFSYKIIKQQKNILPYGLLVFSPFIFLFQVANDGGGFRKEIIYFALMAALVWATYLENTIKFRMAFYGGLVLYPLIILSHEMLIVFLPYLAAVYILSCRITRWDKVFIPFMVAFSIVTFLKIIQPELSLQQIEAIHVSLEKLNYPVEGGVLSYLGKDAAYGFEMVLTALREEDYLFYIAVLCAAMIAYYPVRGRLKTVFRNRSVLLLVLISTFGTLPLLAVAIDWGRFLYIHCVSLFFLLLVRQVAVTGYDGDEKITALVNQWGRKKIIVLLVLYSLLWNMSPSGHPMRSFRRPLKLAFGFVKPYLQLAEFGLGKIKTVNGRPTFIENPVRKETG